MLARSRAMIEIYMKLHVSARSFIMAGGALGRGPHRTRLRRGRRGAPTAGPGGGRRTAVLPVGDALPHAGVLHLHVGGTGSRKRLEAPGQEEHAASRSAGGGVA